MRAINTIFVHCTDRNPLTKRPFASTTELRSFHKSKGWQDIGYHYVVERDGTVMAGRDPETPGAHVAGRNHDSIGVCAIGGEDCRFTFTEEQLLAVLRLLVELCARYNIPTERVLGHREVDRRKACPVMDPEEIRAALRFLRRGTAPACG